MRSRRSRGCCAEHETQRRPTLIQNLSPLELAYCVAVLLLNFTLRGNEPALGPLTRGP